MSDTIQYEGAEYRVIEPSPSQKYILAQKTDYPKTGRFGVFMDAPIDLFHVEEGQVEYIGHTFCPYDTLDNPHLSDILWFEEQGFVKLCFVTAPFYHGTNNDDTNACIPRGTQAFVVLTGV